MSQSGTLSGLKRCLNAPGGITIADAEVRVANHMHMMESRALQFISESVRDIAALMEEADAPPSEETRRKMHALAYTIAGLGGSFEREALGKAARSLCALIDESESDWDDGAARLHVQALRALCALGVTSDEAQADVVAGLVKVRMHLAKERKRLQETLG